MKTLKDISVFIFLFSIVISCADNSKNNINPVINDPADTLNGTDTLNQDTTIVIDSIIPIPANKRIEIISDNGKSLVINYQSPNKVSSIISDQEEYIAVYDSINADQLKRFIGPNDEYNFNWPSADVLVIQNEPTIGAPSGNRISLNSNKQIVSRRSFSNTYGNPSYDYSADYYYDANAIDSMYWNVTGQYGAYGRSLYDCNDSTYPDFPTNMFSIEMKSFLTFSKSIGNTIFDNHLSNRLIKYKEDYSVPNNGIPDWLGKTLVTFKLNLDGTIKAVSERNLWLQIHPITFIVEDTLKDEVINYDFIYTDL